MISGSILFDGLMLFFLLRALMALSWNHELAEMYTRDIENKATSIDEKIASVAAYASWNPVGAIFNPVNFDKWTAMQWYNYQKSKIAK